MASRSIQKSRELRRRVVLPARFRTPAGWSEACILNISSRGLLIHAGRPVSEGVTIQIHHGDHLISGRVVWQRGSRFGLCVDEKLPVEHILTAGQAASLGLAAPCESPPERRHSPRHFEDSRLQSRTMQFVSIAVIASCLAGTLFAMVEQALAKPFAQVLAALGG
ncbi:MAG TPA: PilZ domain-containing protein [Sphingomicrobium sp.]|nr:PilZ domain-containing protein [Sphingomicrobium sp.]